MIKKNELMLFYPLLLFETLFKAGPVGHFRKRTTFLTKLVKS